MPEVVQIRVQRSVQEAKLLVRWDDEDGDRIVGGAYIRRETEILFTLA